MDGNDKPSFQVDKADNVATMLHDAEAGDMILVQGAEARRRLQALDAISLGHKVAIAEILEGDFIVKYGVRIGIATRSVKPGQWIHLHNCRSQVDERSGLFDKVTGAAEDTAYA
jgi:hypothetical protein